MDLNELSNNPEQIKGLIQLLQQLLPKETIKNENSTEQEFKNPIKTKGSRKLDNGRPNKFIDMPEKNMHKEDSKIDQLLSINPPVARAREFTTINVTCRVCGKTESIPPSLATSDSRTRYKCNNCSTSAG